MTQSAVACTSENYAGSPVSTADPHVHTYWYSKELILEKEFAIYFINHSLSKYEKAAKWECLQTL